MVMDQLRTTAKHLCALAVRASENGRQGVEDIFDVIVVNEKLILVMMWI